MELHAISKAQTEARNAGSRHLDALPPLDILSILYDGQLSAAQSVRSALHDIDRAAKAAASALSNGRKIAYVGAGSSGLMALADGLELPGTFSIPIERVKLIFAGGPEYLQHMKGLAEDDRAQAKNDIDRAGISHGDCAILVSASGQTPYILAALRHLKMLGAVTIALTNNPGTAMEKEADIAVFLPTQPEIIAGSTRMGAGTAQKIALNMYSTLMAVHLGHIYDGMMVNLTADNTKLKARAENIIRDITHCSKKQAGDCLQMADGKVKIAVLLAAGVKSKDAAGQLLGENYGKLRPILERLPA